MNNWKRLVEAILEEDKLLRARLSQCPANLREVGGSDGGLSFKETLGHISYWDNFTVDFFTNKLDQKSMNPTGPVNFEENSSGAMDSLDDLPFGEVLARYLEATGSLTSFLSQHWPELSDREKHDFWVPLKHRRQHRLALFQTLDEINPPDEIACEA